MTVMSRNAVAALGILAAMLLGFGAVQELVVRGIRGGEAQPLMIGAVGTGVSMLLAVAALAIWRRHRTARSLALVAAAAGIVFHAYAALPPHRYVGLLALLIAAAYSAVLVAIAFRHPSSPSRDNVDVRRA